MLHIEVIRYCEASARVTCFIYVVAPSLKSVSLFTFYFFRLAD